MFAEMQQRLPKIVVLMALKTLETRAGAERIYRAELNGLKRRDILISAARRMDGFDHPQAVQLKYQFDINQRSNYDPR